MALKDILFLGDIHSSIPVLYSAFETAAEQGINTIIQVGDFWAYEKEDLESLELIHATILDMYGEDISVHFIDGNHEDFRVLNPHGQSPVHLSPHLTYHPRGTVFNIEGVTVGCFGGASSIDRMWRISGKTWFADELPTEEDVEQAIENFVPGSLDVLVTHDVPDFALEQITPRYKIIADSASDEVRSKLDRIVQACKPPVVVHGHWHYPTYKVYEEMQVVSLGCDGNFGSQVSLDGKNEPKILYRTAK